MNTQKFEKLSESKFKALTEDEMKGIDGKGWEIIKCGIAYDSNGHQVTVGIMERKRFGKFTGEYHAFED